VLATLFDIAVVVEGCGDAEVDIALGDGSLGSAGVAYVGDVSGTGDAGAVENGADAETAGLSELDQSSADEGPAGDAYGDPGDEPDDDPPGADARGDADDDEPPGGDAFGDPAADEP
jgi:hypothetical protein